MISWFGSSGMQLSQFSAGMCSLGGGTAALTTRHAGLRTHVAATYPATPASPDFVDPIGECHKAGVTVSTIVDVPALNIAGANVTIDVADGNGTLASAVVVKVCSHNE